MNDRTLDNIATSPTEYRRKPAVIEAMQFRPGENDDDVIAWMKTYFDDVTCHRLYTPHAMITFKDSESGFSAMSGDWIIHVVGDYFEACDPHVFHAKYEPVCQ